jgi:hypothetical protein
MLAWLMVISTNVKNALGLTSTKTGHKILNITNNMIEAEQCAKIESLPVLNTIKQNAEKKLEKRHMQMQKTDDQNDITLASYLTMQSEMGESFARQAAHVVRREE